MSRVGKDNAGRAALGLAICLTLVAWLGVPHRASAQVQVDITEGEVAPLPIAIPRFRAEPEQAREMAGLMTEVIIANLSRSGLFRPLEPSAFIQESVSVDAEPRFADWRRINAQALVAGRIERIAGMRLRADFRLWDVFSGRELSGEQFISTEANWRRLSHIISDAIYERLTGERGNFDTRIAFVAESGPKGNRTKRLAIMDQDGANIQYLTDGTQLVLTPRFSPSASQLAYLSYEAGHPRVYLLDIETGQRELVGDFPAMTFAPRFAPDGHHIVLSLQQGGNANLYLMNLRTRHLRQLTTTAAIDTAPCFSPDGRFIAFESDRTGTSRLYVMRADGSGQQQVSQAEGSYGTPVWSPRGDLIAFTKRLRGRFQIGVMRPDGSGERILTEGFHNEGPTWSPNGRVLLFFREMPGEDAGPQLFAVDVSGGNERRIATPQFGSDPSWSPLLAERVSDLR